MGVWKRKKVVQDYLKTLGISKINDIEKELTLLSGRCKSV